MQQQNQPQQRFRDLLASPSVAPFLLWRARGEKGDIDVTLKDGPRLLVRGHTNDYHTAMEIFCWRQYDLPADVRLDNVRQIIDVGANVGYSLLYFAQKYPDAHITAFEPHPEHLARIRAHLEANRLSDRVTLIEAAAGTQEAQAFLSDEGAGSAVQGSGGLPIAIVDFYANLPDGKIDILKMDIEGGEYALLSDPRFPGVAERTRCIALEWHRCVVMEYGKGAAAAADASPPVAITDGADWCRRRLTGLGFRIIEGGVQYGVAGTFWAVRD